MEGISMWREVLGIPEAGAHDHVPATTLLRLARLGIVIDLVLAVANILTRFALGADADIRLYDYFLLLNVPAHVIVVTSLIVVVRSSGELPAARIALHVAIAASAWTCVIASWMIGGISVALNMIFAAFLLSFVRLTLGAWLGVYCFAALFVTDLVAAILRIAEVFPSRSPIPDYVLDDAGRAIATVGWRTIALGMIFVLISYVASRLRQSELMLRARNAELERRFALQAHLFDEASPADAATAEAPSAPAETPDVTLSAPFDSLDHTLPLASAQRATEIAPGTRLGRYEVLRKLGAGAMGIVYEAHDAELARVVALKLVRPRRGDVVSARARLRHEARVMARLTHPNVAAIFDIGRYEDQLFVAMELVRGGTVRDLVGGARPWIADLQVLVAAGRGLAAAHDAGIVHRDFKPDNVLLRVDGTVRVSDFGLAHEGGLDASGTSLVGTPAYMAPEGFDGVADTSTDQFAFATTLFEVLEGRRPFAPLDSIADYRAALRRGERIPWRRRDVPAAIRAAIDRGLSLDPAARWPSMAAFCDALDRLSRPDHARTIALVGFSIVVLVWALVALLR